MKIIRSIRNIYMIKMTITQNVHKESSRLMKAWFQVRFLKTHIKLCL